DVQGGSAQDAGGDQGVLDLVLQTQALFLPLDASDLFGLGSPVAPLPCGVFGGVVADGGSEPAGAVHGHQLLGREIVGDVYGVRAFISARTQICNYILESVADHDAVGVRLHARLVGHAKPLQL